MILPYSIKQFTIQNFQGIVESRLEGLPASSQWIFLTGKNGYGKTSLLRALAIGLYGDTDKADDEKRLAGKETLVELQVNDRNKDALGFKPRWVAQGGKYTKHEIAVLAYGPVRIPSEKQSKTTGSPVKSLFSTDGDILNDFEAELVNLYQNESKADLEWRNEVMNDYNMATGSLYSLGAHFPTEENQELNLDHHMDQLSQIKGKKHFVGKFLKEHKEIFSEKKFSIKYMEDLQKEYAVFKDTSGQLPLYNAIRSFFLELMDNIKEMEVKENRLIFYEKEQSNVSKFMEQLASGNRTLFTWVGDMLMRLKYREFTHPKDIGAIVIIDEFDLHLHPIWQKRLPGILSKNLPNIQFVVSTHSPIPLLGAPEGSVFLKVERDPERGIEVVRWDEKIPLKKLLPNALLNSPLFDLDDLFPADQKLKDIRTEDQFEEAFFNYMLQKKVDELKENSK